MDHGELVDHLNRDLNEWPNSSWGGTAGNLAAVAEHRLLKAIGDQEIIWATGKSGQGEDGGISVDAVVFTRGYVVTDSATAPEGQSAPHFGKTRVIPWTGLEGLTLHEYWPAGTGSQTEYAHFTVHLGGGHDFEVRSNSFAGRSAAVELFDFVRSQLVTKQAGVITL